MTLPNAFPIELIEALFDHHGHLEYGEQVSQIEHALQCASLAEQADASDELITAAMLHDVGHMLHRDAASALQAGQDDRHEALGAKYLARWFGPGVYEPVALHVHAKRYLCARDPGYLERLSEVSQRSLALQGGLMSDAQAVWFEALPYAGDAVRLRRWDDEGKCRGMQTASLVHYLGIAQHCVRTR